MIKKGFTFIEVIIVFTIVFIMTAVLLGTSYKDRSKKEIEATAREITATIRETQNNALTGKQRGSKLPCSFTFIPSTDGYQMFYEARDIDGACGSDEKFFDKIQLPTGITISTTKVKGDGDGDGDGSVGDTGITFNVPYGNFNIGGDDTFKGVDIRVTKDEKNYHICVHSTGLVEELGFSESKDDLVCAF